MKKILKRFKLSEWLIISQIVLSVATLLLATFLGNEIIDIIALIGNVVNGIILILVFFAENSKSIKSHELMAQFIFNRVGDNFNEFMDFLMSDKYERISLNEHNLLHDKLVMMAKGDDYETKRKLARAIPYIFDIDKRMAEDIIKVLRRDLYNDRTDIRRRTIEAMLSIIERQQSVKKQRRYAREFFDLFAYKDYDDSYTVVASIESYFFLHEFVWREKEKEEIFRAFEALKASVQKASELNIGAIELSLVGDMDNIWASLSALSTIQHIDNPGYKEARNHIDKVLLGGAKFSKLTIVKNLYYTCEGFPECLHGAGCGASSSKYMMDKIHGFLTEALDGDVFLSMPTVRYFDCVCNNVCKSEAGGVARSIISGYFSSSELLISQTAFDKFSKLLKEDAKFATGILTKLLTEETKHSAKESADIVARLEKLPECERALFSVELSRTKLKNTVEKADIPKSVSDEAKEIFALIENYNKRIKYIGKIKKFKEDNKL